MQNVLAILMLLIVVSRRVGCILKMLLHLADPKKLLSSGSRGHLLYLLIFDLLLQQLRHSDISVVLELLNPRFEQLSVWKLVFFRVSLHGDLKLLRVPGARHQVRQFFIVERRVIDIAGPFRGTCLQVTEGSCHPIEG